MSGGAPTVPQSPTACSSPFPLRGSFMAGNRYHGPFGQEKNEEEGQRAWSTAGSRLRASGGSVTEFAAVGRALASSPPWEGHWPAVHGVRPRIRLIPCADSSAFGKNPAAGLSAISSVYSVSARAEIMITGALPA